MQSLTGRPHHGPGHGTMEDQGIGQCGIARTRLERPLRWNLIREQYRFCPARQDLQVEERRFTENRRPRFRNRADGHRCCRMSEDCKRAERVQRSIWHWWGQWIDAAKKSRIQLWPRVMIETCLQVVPIATTNDSQGYMVQVRCERTIPRQVELLYTPARLLSPQSSMVSMETKIGSFRE